MDGTSARSRTGRFAVLGSLVVIGSVVIAGALGSSGTPSSDTGTARRGLDLPSGCGGKELSLGEAAGIVPFQVLVPELPLASRRSLPTVEWCEASGLLIMPFDSGVRVELSLSQITDVPADFEDQARGHVGTTVGTVRGVPAVSTEPGSKDESALEPAPGGVEFVEGALLVDVVGDGMVQLDDLIAIAESLKAYAANG